MTVLTKTGLTIMGSLTIGTAHAATERPSAGHSTKTNQASIVDAKNQVISRQALRKNPKFAEKGPLSTNIGILEDQRCESTTIYRSRNGHCWPPPRTDPYVNDWLIRLLLSVGRETGLGAMVG
jgi:hypothetical protein